MTETEFVQALRALMRPGGKPDDFVIDQDDCSIRIEYFGGSGSHVVVSAPYVGRALGAGDGYRGRARLEGPRPMRIALRREKASDVRAKTSGIAVEAQTGDAAFDEAVYVDSPAAPELLQQVLQAQALRDAVRALLSKDLGPITLDDFMGRIQLRISGFSGLRNPGQVLTPFAAIVNNVPEVAASGKTQQVDLWQAAQFLLGGAMFLGLIPVGLSVFALLPERCYVSDSEGTSLSCSDPACCSPAQYGLGGGALVGALLAATLFVRIRGASNSHTVRRWVAFFTLLLGIEAGLVTAHVLAGVLLR